MIDGHHTGNNWNVSNGIKETSLNWINISLARYSPKYTQRNYVIMNNRGEMGINSELLKTMDNYGYAVNITSS